MADAPALSGSTILELVYFDAGGGHRASAGALQEAIRLQRRPWQVRLVNLQEILEPLDVAQRLFGVGTQDLYNAMLRRGWTVGAAAELRLLHGLIRLTHGRQVELLAAHWRQSRPGLVVSLVPNFNRAIHESVRRALPGVPSVTVLTDLADYPPHFWIEADTPAVVCGTAEAARQAAAAGVAAAGIHQVSGMILDPRWYAEPELDAGAVRAELGLAPEQTTALVLFGGFGSGRMLGVARAVERAGLALQLVLVCGHNRRLEASLGALARQARTRMSVVGFTRELPRLMAASDFMIGKPGPGSVSEALQRRLPLVVERNWSTLPQERFNADWVQAQGLGIAVRSRRELAPALRRMLDAGERAAMRERAAAVHNRAVWEIPEILARLLGAQAQQA